jgi:hypothetical protein
MTLLIKDINFSRLILGEPSHLAIVALERIAQVKCQPVEAPYFANWAEFTGK